MDAVISHFQGRIRRATYWLLILMLVIIQVAVGWLVSPFVASLLGLPIWISAAGRRLHDFNVTAWVSAVPFGLGFALGFLKGIGLGLPMTDVQGAAVGGIASIAFAIVLGSIPGTRGDNRYGPQPGISEYREGNTNRHHT